MNAELDRLRKEMTREEFIQKYKKNGMECPVEFDLEDINECCYPDNCEQCYREAVKDIQFKDDIEPKTTIQDSGNRTEFLTGAVRDIHEGKGRMDLIPACALLRVSRHFEAGAIKYGENNWQKGIPIHSYMDSMLRHIIKYLDGQTEEDHLAAAVWNGLCAMWTEEKKPEMQDIPTRMAVEE